MLPLWKAEPLTVSSKKPSVIIVVKGGISRGGTSNHKEGTEEETDGGKREPSGLTENRTLKKNQMRILEFMLNRSWLTVQSRWSSSLMASL